MSRRHTLSTALIVSLALAGVPAAASAQNGASGYNRVADVAPTLPLSGGGGGGGGEVAGAQAAGGELPFTGLDLGYVALAGAALMAAGFGLRQIRRQPEA